MVESAFVKQYGSNTAPLTSVLGRIPKNGALTHLRDRTTCRSPSPYSISNPAMESLCGARMTPTTRNHSPHLTTTDDASIGLVDHDRRNAVPGKILLGFLYN